MSDRLPIARRAPSPRADGGDRLPPHSTEAEQGVLGCILLDPSTCLTEAQVALATPQAFYDLRHRSIYEAMMAMMDTGVPVDLITLQQRLKDQHQLEGVGGLVYLSALPDAVPSAVNVSYYLQIVAEKFRLRRMVATMTECTARVYDWEGDVTHLLDSIEHDVLAVNAGHDQHAAVKIGALVMENLVSLDDENYMRGRGKIEGVLSGLKYFDKQTGGLHNGELIVIAGRPGLGKTSLGVNILQHAAVTQKLPVAMFSVEMSGMDITFRAMCDLARVSFHGIRTGFMSKSEHATLIEHSKPLARAPLWIDDTPGLHINALRARARRLHQRHGIRLLLVDYLQLCAADGNNDTERYSRVSTGLKQLSRELKIPVVALSQLNRELEKERHRKPQLADLRGSGSIEQDADLVAFLYERKLSDKDEASVALAAQCERDKKLPVNLFIAKQRNGPTGDGELFFYREQMRFVDAGSERRAPEPTPDAAPLRGNIDPADVPEPPPKNLL